MGGRQVSATVQSVHIWGFFDDDGGRRLPDGGAPSSLSPYDHFCRVRRNVHHFGGELDDLRTTRTLDGWLVGVEFETPERKDGKAARMWHVIAEPRSPWGDPTTAAQQVADMRAVADQAAREGGAE
jgi:hypothetical protein